MAPRSRVTGKLLIEPTASPAVDATIHFMLDKDAQILITISPLFSKIAPDPMAACNGHILEQTVAAFITDRAIMGMVHHEPLDHMLAEVDCLFIGRRNDHTVLGIDHAAHLHPFDRALQKLHRTHAAGADRSQAGMIAETRDDDAQPFGGLNHFHPFRNFYFKTVNLQLGHITSL